jgi:hypothetical protein
MHKRQKLLFSIQRERQPVRIQGVHMQRHFVLRQCLRLLDIVVPSARVDLHAALKSLADSAGALTLFESG